jgi:digeranylgeranylglycerophospholipid reductase
LAAPALLEVGHTKRYDCDVAVVGAGPAGSRCARNLAAGGLKVALLEEHRRIGVPSHCSGLVSPRTLEEADVLEPIVANRLTGAYVHTVSGGQLALGGGDTRALTIDRVRLDELLCEQAQAAGADLLRARVVHAERQNGGVHLRCQRDGRDLQLSARLVVGADGAHSRVARSLGLPGAREKVYCLGIEGRLRVPREDFVHVFVGRGLAPGWFGWLIPTGGGQVRAGIGCDRSDKPIRCYRRLVDAFPHLLRDIQVGRMYGGTIPLGFAPRSYGDDVLLVGDAAGQVKPFSGGGIYMGLVAARHAASAAAAALAADDTSADGLRGYERAWKSEIGRELTRSLRIRRFGLRLSDSDVERLVASLSHQGLQPLIARHGDIDYPSRVILRLARSLPALWPLVRLSLRRPLASLQLLRAFLPGG